jgi:hypothetical protein
MAGRIAYYGGIVTNGLVLDLDAAKKDSYPGTGTAWNDISGNRNNGTLTNGPTFNSDNGGSIVFDGVDDYVEVIRSSNYDFNQTNSFTIAGWFFITNTRSNSPFLGKWGTNSSSNGSYLLWAGGLGGNNLVFSVALGTSTIATTPPVSYNFNQWNYFVGVYIGGTRLESYINNSNANITNYTGNINNPTNVNLRIAKFDATSETFTGNTSLIQVYNRALSATEVLQNYNALKSRYL